MLLRLSEPVLTLIFGVLVVHGQFEDDPCVRKYDNSPGTCRKHTDCPRVREEYKVGVPLTICAYISGKPVVCCPDSGGSAAFPASNNNNNDFNRPTQTGLPSSGKRISVQKCEEYAQLTEDKIFVNGLAQSSNQHAFSLSKCNPSTPLIVGGVKTKPGEYPHMVAIGWRFFDNDETNVEFKCGGSLISDRFVLTAAHCYRADRTRPSFVRLGDQNVRTKSDGVKEVDIDIAEFIKHENYRNNGQDNDIALIKLEKVVRFSNNIRPACLWSKTDIDSKTTVATGWGYTEALGPVSDELMKVELDILSSSYCNNAYDTLKNGLTEKMLCAGKLAGGQDTCQGDSGGPIQITTPNNVCLYYIIGITSFGTPFCAQKNTPGVYTRVSSYIDWIEDKVWG